VGDIIIDINSLYHADCFDILPKVEDDSIDIIVTDTPYGIGYQSNWGRDGEKLKQIENDNNLDEWFQKFTDESYRVLKNNTAFYCFTRFDVYPTMYNCLIKSGFKIKNLLVLQKGQKGGNGDLQAQYANDCEFLIYANKGRRKFNKTQLVKTDGRKGSNPYRTRLPNVWFDTSYNIYPKATVNVSNQNGITIHPTEKNTDLIEWLLLISSNENDIVLDSFMGSGTTAIASINTNRNFIGVEIESEYYNLAKNRINNHIIDNDLQDKYDLIA
jgi:site-specific DNA-methyltransferase (adenine-specific)